MNIKQRFTNCGAGVTPGKVLAARWLAWGNLLIAVLLLFVMSPGPWLIIPIFGAMAGMNYVDENRDKV
jgi:hypothetical protein